VATHQEIAVEAARVGKISSSEVGMFAARLDANEAGTLALLNALAALPTGGVPVAGRVFLSDGDGPGFSLAFDDAAWLGVSTSQSARSYASVPVGAALSAQVADPEIAYAEMFGLWDAGKHGYQAVVPASFSQKDFDDYVDAVTFGGSQGVFGAAIESLERRAEADGVDSMQLRTAAERVIYGR